MGRSTQSTHLSIYDSPNIIATSLLGFGELQGSVSRIQKADFTGSAGRLARWMLIYAYLFLACAFGWDQVVAADATQVPSRPSERSLESPADRTEKAPGEFVLPPVPEVQPEQALAGPVIQIEAIAFEGNRVISSEELLAVVGPYIGCKCTAAEIEELRHLITRYYIGRGYINSGAVLPDDGYRDGVLTVSIIEGTIDEIQLSGQGRLREAYIRDRLSRPGEPFNVNVLQERFQLLLTDPLFAKVNARVSPGTSPGRAILDVDVTRARPYQLSLFVNNYRPPSIGSEAYGVAGWVGNLTGFGDVLDGSYQYGRGGGRYGLGWALPIGARGTIFQTRYEEGVSALIEESLSELDIESEFKSLELTVSQPLIDRVRQRFAVGLTWTRRESASTLLGRPFSFVPGEPEGRTEIRAWRLFQDYLHRWERSVLAVRSTFTLGASNILEGQLPVLTPERNYFAWLGQFQYVHRVLDNGAQVLLRGIVQETPDRLVPLEQIAIGGMPTVRGYLQNQLVRDKGYAASVEFHYPVARAAGPDRFLTIIAFTDHGAAQNQNRASDRLASVGIGVNARYRGLVGELYFAHRLRDVPGDTGSNLQDKGIQFQVRYDMF